MARRKLLVLAALAAVSLPLLPGESSESAHVNPAVVATIPVGLSPQGVDVNPISGRVYVANSSDDTVSIIDGGTDKVVATVPVGNQPADVAVDPGSGRVYVIILDGLFVIDERTGAEIADFPLQRGATAVAIDAVSGRLYVTHPGGVSVVNSSTGRVVAEISVPIPPQGSIDDLRGVAVNPTRAKVYISGNVNAAAYAIDGASNATVASMPVGLGPNGVAVDPTRDRVYVTNFGSDTVSIIDSSTDSVMATVPMPDGPLNVAVNPATNLIYVASQHANVVSVLEGTAHTIVATVPVAGPANFASKDGIALNVATDRVYAANQFENTVLVIADGTLLPPLGGEPGRSNRGVSEALMMAALGTLLLALGALAVVPRR